MFVYGLFKKSVSKPVIRERLGLWYYFSLSEDTPSLQ